MVRKCAFVGARRPAGLPLPRPPTYNSQGTRLYIVCFLRTSQARIHVHEGTGPRFAGWRNPPIAGGLRQVSHLPCFGRQKAALPDIHLQGPTLTRPKRAGGVGGRLGRPLGLWQGLADRSTSARLPKKTRVGWRAGLGIIIDYDHTTILLNEGNLQAP